MIKKELIDAIQRVQVDFEFALHAYIDSRDQPDDSAYERCLERAKTLGSLYKSVMFLAEKRDINKYDILL